MTFGDPALEHECPTCNAKPNEPCWLKQANTFMRGIVHKARRGNAPYPEPYVAKPRRDVDEPEIF